jgi:uncharacterized protein with PQ loop repeat
MLSILTKHRVKSIAVTARNQIGLRSAAYDAPMGADDWIGFIGGLLTCSAILPQIYKSYRHGATRDLSWAMFSVFYVGTGFTLTYGLMIEEPAVYTTAAYSLVTNTTLVAIKAYHEIYLPTYRPLPSQDIEMENMLGTST